MIHRINSPYSVGRINRPRVGAGWSPTDIAGCQLWLDFSDASTLFTDAGITRVQNDGDLIYQANDKSGNGKHLTQSIEANRPKYKTGIKNGLSTGLFEATDALDFSDTTPFDGGLDYTILIAFYINTLRNYNHLLAGDPGYFNSHTDANGAVYAGTSFVVKDRVQTNNGYLAAATYYLLDITKNGDSAGNLSLFKNGANRVTNGTSIAPAPGESYGMYSLSRSDTNYHLDGYALEVLIYDNAVGDDNLPLLRNYINSKWAIY